MLPFCNSGSVSVLDHIFTAVSALSTTGLPTVDMYADYSFWEQLVVLFLIQLEGFGYMTFSSYIVFGLTKHLGTNEAQVFHSQFSFPDKMQTNGMLKNIVNFALFFELLGIVLLYPYFAHIDVAHPLWAAIFHSVSAFCTAGFSIFSDNLMQFRGDWYVNVVLATLSYMGAMGFIMMTDVLRKFTRKGYRISFTTKVIASITTILTLWSTAHLFFLESSLQSLPAGERFLVSLFQSMSAITTVGFNTVDISSFFFPSLVVLSFCMYVGASPSGIGGGLKSTTLSAILAYTKNKLGLRKDMTIAGNKVPAYRGDAALTTTIFYTMLLSIGIYFMTLFEGNDTNFLNIVFEATSALATAGLSSGILSSITICSKIVLIIRMFIGRVGVVTVGNVMLICAHKKKIKHKDDLVV